MAETRSVGTAPPIEPSIAIQSQDAKAKTATPATLPIKRAPFYKVFRTRDDYKAHLAKQNSETKDEKESKISKPINILFRGCDGTGDEIQAAVTKRFNEVSQELKDQGSEVDFYIHLGDSVYPNGPESATDERFKLFKKYGNKVCFYTFGNHDGNKHNGEKIGFDIDEDKIEYYLKQTILTDGKEDQVKMDILKEDYLILDEMEKAGMTLVAPDVFYGYEFEGVEFYHGNSNQFAKDFLSLFEKKSEKGPYERKKDIDSTNQAVFFENRLNLQATDKPKVVSQHVPFDPVNKLAFAPDTHIFINLIKENIEKLDAILGEGTSKLEHGAILKKMYAHLGILDKPEIYFAAHQHAMCEVIEDDLRVAVAGGGGETSQSQLHFGKLCVPFYSAEKGDETTPTQKAEKHGFVHTQIQKTESGLKVTNRFHHCDRSVIQFSGDKTADRAHDEDHQITIFRDTVLAACADCFKANSAYAPYSVIAQFLRINNNSRFAFVRKLVSSSTPLDDFTRIQRLCTEFHALTTQALRDEESVKLKDYVQLLTKTVAAITTMLPSDKTLTVFLDKRFNDAFGKSYQNYVNTFYGKQKMPAKIDVTASSAPLEIKSGCGPSPVIVSPAVATPSETKSLFSKENELRAKKKLRDVVTKGCNEYKKFLASKPKSSPEGYIRRTAGFVSGFFQGPDVATTITEYFSSAENSSKLVQLDLEFLQKQFAMDTNQDKNNSLLAFFNKELREFCGASFDQVIKNPKIFLFSNPRPIPTKTDSKNKPPLSRMFSLPNFSPKKRHQISSLSSSVEARRCDPIELGSIARSPV